MTVDMICIALLIRFESNVELYSSESAISPCICPCDVIVLCATGERKQRAQNTSSVTGGHILGSSTVLNHLS